MHHAEEEELPKYEPDALQVEAAAQAKMMGPLVVTGFLVAYVPTGGIRIHMMRSLLYSRRIVLPGLCVYAVLSPPEKTIFGYLRK
uniref:Uncharacterized protein n=1 Tax=Oryza sativa subsp. japonica TaxID=39947 RepID=Q6K414_ORYSJ|nr:hypothetical protein [Oryza sativa Japonica Group]